MPNYVQAEFTAAMAINQRLSERNQEYKFFYNSEGSFLDSSRFSIDPFENQYSSRSLHESDRDNALKQSTVMLCQKAELEDGTKAFALADVAKLQRELPEKVLNELELFLFNVNEDGESLDEVKND